MTSRWPWLILSVLLLVGIGAWISRACHGSGEVGGKSPSVVDSSRVVAVRDSLVRVVASERRRADSLQACMDTCPDSVVVRTLTHLVPVAVPAPGVPADTVRVGSDLLRAAVDSLASCHVARDSLGGDGLLWRERDKAHAEALRLCQLSLGSTPAPSSGGTRWTVSAVLQADGDALRPGLGVDWRPFEHLQVGAEGYARRDFTKPGAGLRLGFSF